jgi:ribulose kinase
LLDRHGRILADSTGTSRLAVSSGSRALRAHLVGPVENTITYRDESDHRIFEQSASNIWSCLAKCCKSVLQQSGVSPQAVKGVSFDATCSLTAVDDNGTPISVTKGDGLGKAGDRNIILWADHRAEKEAEEINKTGEAVLNFVGGVMSVSLLLSLLPSFSEQNLCFYASAGNGDSENPLVEAKHER